MWYMSSRGRSRGPRPTFLAVCLGALLSTLIGVLIPDIAAGQTRLPNNCVLSGNSSFHCYSLIYGVNGGQSAADELFMNVKSRCLNGIPYGSADANNEQRHSSNEMWAVTYSPNYWVESGQTLAYDQSSSTVRRWMYGYGTPTNSFHYYFGSWANNTSYAGLAIQNNTADRKDWLFWYGSTKMGEFYFGGDPTHMSGPIQIANHGWLAGAETNATGAQVSIYDTGLGFYRSGVKYTSWYANVAENNVPPFTSTAQFGANWLADYNPSVSGAAGC